MAEASDLLVAVVHMIFRFFFAYVSSSQKASDELAEAKQDASWIRYVSAATCSASATIVAAFSFFPRLDLPAAAVCARNVS